MEDVVEQPRSDGVEHLLDCTGLLVDILLLVRLGAFGRAGTGTGTRGLLYLLGRDWLFREFWCRHFFTPVCRFVEGPCALCCGESSSLGSYTYPLAPPKELHTYKHYTHRPHCHNRNWEKIRLFSFFVSEPNAWQLLRPRACGLVVGGEKSWQHFQGRVTETLGAGSEYRIFSAGAPRTARRAQRRIPRTGDAIRRAASRHGRLRIDSRAAGRTRRCPAHSRAAGHPLLHCTRVAAPVSRRRDGRLP